MEENQEMHLDVYSDRSELHYEGETVVFREGCQNEAANNRYKLIQDKLKNGFLDEVYNNASDFDFSNFEEESIALLNSLVDSITSEYGRGLVGLTFLQLTIKTITPQQCIRLHKGSTIRSNFSWVDGISMRVLDKNYNTKFLREKGLLRLNADGAICQCSPAQQAFPYFPQCIHLLSLKWQLWDKQH